MWSEGEVRGSSPCAGACRPDVRNVCDSPNACPANFRPPSWEPLYKCAFTILTWSSPWVEASCNVTLCDGWIANKHMFCASRICLAFFFCLVSLFLMKLIGHFQSPLVPFSSVSLRSLFISPNSHPNFHWISERVEWMNKSNVNASKTSVFNQTTISLSVLQPPSLLKWGIARGFWIHPDTVSFQIVTKDQCLAF